MTGYPLVLKVVIFYTVFMKINVGLVSVVQINIYYFVVFNKLALS